MKTQVAGRGWTHWYKLPFIQYGVADVSVPATGTEQSEYGTRLLRYRKGQRMLRGADVLAVQARLTELGFDSGKVDGVYGPITAAAVTAFQQVKGITVDGIVGPQTRQALTKAEGTSDQSDATRAANG